MRDGTTPNGRGETCWEAPPMSPPKPVPQSSGTKAPESQSKPGQMGGVSRWRPGARRCWYGLQPSLQPQIYPVRARSCKAWIIGQSDRVRVEIHGPSDLRQRGLSGGEERREELEGGPIFNSEVPPPFAACLLPTPYPTSPRSTCTALALGQRALGWESGGPSPSPSSPMV